MFCLHAEDILGTRAQGVQQAGRSGECHGKHLAEHVTFSRYGDVKCIGQVSRLAAMHVHAWVINRYGLHQDRDKRVGAAVHGG